MIMFIRRRGEEEMSNLLKMIRQQNTHNFHSLKTL